MRPSKLTKAKIKTASDAIKRCNTFANAARLVGVSYATFCNWRNAGREEAEKEEENRDSDKALYLEFFYAVEEAAAIAEDRLVSGLEEDAIGREVVETTEVYKVLNDEDRSLVEGILRLHDENGEIEPILVERKTKTTIKRDTKAAIFLLQNRNPLWRGDKTQDTPPLPETAQKVVDTWIKRLTARAEGGDDSAIKTLIELGVIPRKGE